MFRSQPRRSACGAVLIALALAAGAVPQAQEPFSFVLSSTDSTGAPVTDITKDEVVMTENGVANQVLKVEPYRVPVKLTITVDNGPLSADALSHYRSGLEGLIKALPEDVEVSIVSTAPQPRAVVRPTTNREQLLRGVNGFAPERGSPRFVDAFVEFTRRFEKELEDKKNRIDSMPVLMMVATTSPDTPSYEVPEINRAITFFQQRKSRLYVTMISAKQNVGNLATIDTNNQALIAIPVAKATGGRFEPLAVSNRLATLLPEIGAEIAALHRTLNNQLLVTVQRQPGPLQNPNVEVKRPGLTGRVSLDGIP